MEERITGRWRNEIEYAVINGNLASSISKCAPNIFSIYLSPSIPQTALHVGASHTFPSDYDLVG